MNRPAWHLYTGRAYVPAAATDIRVTFERVRQEMQAREFEKQPRPQVVRQLKIRKKA